MKGLAKSFWERSLDRTTRWHVPVTPMDPPAEAAAKPPAEALAA